MVLRFSTKSFHYKTVRYVMGEEYFLYRLNLCKYFWTFVFSVVFMMPLLIARSVNKIRWPKVQIRWPTTPKNKARRYLHYFMIVWTGVLAVVAINDYYQHLYVWVVIQIIAGLFMWTPTLAGPLFKRLIAWELERDRKRWVKQRTKVPKIQKPKEPNLAWEYLKARKARICPYIVWEE